ncbi:uncharacterized protein FTOL_01501 [Fusarium torulosum]|uniref:Uncharacterized protein n=1 Tax=Fusarium torulosum TaxID=33205 RepID=A0AAE8SDH0_9HYPO|nr:uncharacterized protein FTOL_01501 [Fusarium torulosum]
MTAGQDFNTKPTLPPKTPLILPSVRSGAVSPLKSLSNNDPPSDSFVGASSVAKAFNGIATTSISFKSEPADQEHLANNPNHLVSLISSTVANANVPHENGMEEDFDPADHFSQIHQQLLVLLQHVAGLHDAIESIDSPDIYDQLHMITKELRVAYTKTFENDRRLSDIEEAMKPLFLNFEDHSTLVTDVDSLLLNQQVNVSSKLLDQLSYKLTDEMHPSLATIDGLKNKEPLLEKQAEWIIR